MNWFRRGGVLILALAVYGCDHARKSAPTPRSARATQLDEARAKLDRGDAEGAIGNITLAGYSFSREVGVGAGKRVIVISCNLAGGIALYDRNGSLVSTTRTQEITSLQVVDVDEDGVADLLTEEIDGRGTGVLLKSFRLYRVETDAVRQVWQGESYNRRENERGRVRELIGFLRFDPSGGGRNARLTHLMIGEGHEQREQFFEWRNRTLERVTK